MLIFHLIINNQNKKTMQTIGKINLSKLKRCNQVWDNMPENDQGRICQKCKETIVDFRNKSFHRIAEIHALSDKPVCGIYSKAQLNSTKKAPKKVRLSKVYATVLALFTTTLVKAQSNAQVTKTEQTELDYTTEINRNEVLSDTVCINDSIVISGTISDETGTKLPIANVFLKGTKYGTTTDFDGNYILYLPSDNDTARENILVFSYVGYLTKEIRIDQLREELNIDVVLNENNVTAFGVTVQPWYKRKWYRIINFFRFKR